MAWSVAFLVGLGACNGSVPADAGMTDAGLDATAPRPTCEPRPEAPSCEGEGCVLSPRCPPGWAPHCDRTGVWTYHDITGCLVPGYPALCDESGTATCPVKIEVRCARPREVVVDPGTPDERTIHCESPEGWPITYSP